MVMNDMDDRCTSGMPKRRNAESRFSAKSVGVPNDVGGGGAAMTNEVRRNAECSETSNNSLRIIIVLPN